AVVLFVPAANVPRRKPAIIIASAGSLFRLEQTPLWTPLRDLIERRRLLETLDRREWAIILERHKLYQLDLLAFREGHDCFLPMRAPAERSADALFFSGVVASVHIDHFLLEQTLHRVFDLNFVRARTDPKNVFVQFFAQQRRFLGECLFVNNLVR